MMSVWLIISLAICVSFILFVNWGTIPVNRTISRTFQAPIGQAFDYIVPVELAHIFKRQGRFPAILRTDETEKWIRPGLTRTIYFEDGTTARETLTTVSGQESFSYIIENFTSPMRFLAKRMEGNWTFSDLGHDRTGIRWTYRVIPTNFLAKAVLNALVMKDLTALMSQALLILKRDLDPHRDGDAEVWGFTRNAGIPANWAQYTVEDTIQVPREKYWELASRLDLEKIGSVGNYKNLPRIVRTEPVNGDFSALGHSRRVFFNTGKTVLESIIGYDKPRDFAYELSDLEINLRRVAHRARGHFSYTELAGGRTRVVWTYGFDQKNVIFKWFLKRYIRSTHRFWMKDTLSEMKRQAEEMYKSGK